MAVNNKAKKIAIHHIPGSFSDRWVTFCQKNGIPFKHVDCYDSDIIHQLADCNGLMWHWHQSDPKAVLFARQLIFSVEAMGKKVFPDSKTSWHFDDKVGQKYLLEAIEAPLVPAYVFYDRVTAANWINASVFPKVFKQRGGAGSVNVSLVRSRKQAHRLVKKAFGRGFPLLDRGAMLKDRLMLFKKSPSLSTTWGLSKGLARYFIPTDYERVMGRAKGYLYFQDFIPGNDSDIRVIVIGDKAVAIKRMVRDGDFRASGSGAIFYDITEIDKRYIEIAFDITGKLNGQCLAFDFVNYNNMPLIIEISYGFSMAAYDKCPGFWDINLDWHQETLCLPTVIIENFIASLAR